MNNLHNMKHGVQNANYPIHGGIVNLKKKNQCEERGYPMGLKTNRFLSENEIADLEARLPVYKTRLAELLSNKPKCIRTTTGRPSESKRNKKWSDWHDEYSEAFGWAGLFELLIKNHREE